MNSEEQGGSAAARSQAASAGKEHGSFAAMPKLPSRPSATKAKTADTGSTGAAATTDNASNSDSSCNTAANSEPKTAAAAASSSRPSCGPTLPPRATRPATASAKPPTTTTTTTTPAASASAPAVPTPSTSSSEPPPAAAATPTPTPSNPTTTPTTTPTTRRAGGLSALPPRGGLLPLPPSSTTSGPVLDPDEPAALAEVRRSIHAVRVQMISSALRLGYDHENALVKQVLYRLALAERLKAPWRRPGKRPDPVAAAAREAARRMEEAKAAAAAAGGEAGAGTGGGGAATEGEPAGGAAEEPGLGFTVKIMLIGLQGSGKTQLAHALLGPTASSSTSSTSSSSSGSNSPTSSPSASAAAGAANGPTGQSAPQPPQPQPQQHAAVHPFEGATRRVTVLRGAAHGIGLEFIDTPGLSLAAGGAARNCGVLQQIRRAYLAHRPDLLVYVDRLDAPAPAAG
ncbi:hypothetical protein Agub_g10415, partial [Astrephomene gubernaculifera]